MQSVYFTTLNYALTELKDQQRAVEGTRLLLSISCYVIKRNQNYVFSVCWYRVSGRFSMFLIIL